LTVTLTGTDIRGQTIEQEVKSSIVSRAGALLTGVRHRLRAGSEVVLVRANRREHFEVAWVGEGNTSRSGQVGLKAVNEATSFWNDVIGIEPQEAANAVQNHPGKIEEKLRAKAHGA
jgi:hypothetical protein